MSEPADRDLARRLEGHLQPTAVPGADATWHQIAPRLATAPQRRPPGLTTQLALTVGAIVVLGAVLLRVWPTAPGGGPASQQPAAGSQAGQAVSTPTVSGTALAIPARDNATDFLFNLQPTPTFQVLRPSYLPPGARLAAAVYNPSPPQAPVRLAGPDADPAIAAATEQRVQQLLGDRQGAALILIYAIGPDQFLEIVQRPDSASPWPVQNGAAQMSGEPTTARKARAVFAQRDGREVLSWIDIASPASETSFVEVLTTLGREVASQVANGLQNIALPNPRPAAATIVPLEERQKAIHDPQASPEQVASECGPWPAAAISATQTSDLPTAARSQIDCAARLIAGLPRTPATPFTVSIGHDTWRAALARYGLPSSHSATGDPPVWTVTAGISETGGTIVILDAATGNPLLLVEILP